MVILKWIKLRQLKIKKDCSLYYRYSDLERKLFVCPSLNKMDKIWCKHKSLQFLTASP